MEDTLISKILVSKKADGNYLNPKFSKCVTLTAKEKSYKSGSVILLNVAAGTSKFVQTD